MLFGCSMACMLDGAASLGGSRQRANVLSYEQDGAAVPELTLEEDLAWNEAHHVSDQAACPAKRADIHTLSLDLAPAVAHLFQQRLELFAGFLCLC